MTMKLTSDPMPPDLSSFCLDHAPMPMATVEGPMHIVRYVNPALCRMISKAKNEVVGYPFRETLPEMGECSALLDRVYRSGNSESYTEPEQSDHNPVFWSCTAWPVMADEHTVGVTLQVIETAPLYEKTLAMNEALILGSLRQHELTAVADSSNTRLQAEVGVRQQGERDAQMLTSEVSHRIKNNLQVVVGLIGREAKRAAPPCVQGFEVIQAQIAAIAELYDLMSQSSRGETVAVDAYLRAMARTLSASLLAKTSRLKFEVDAEALDIDPKQAVPFGLLVNELATNAIKHAFPDGTGRVILRARQIGDQVVLDVTDDGAGMKDNESAKTSEKRGANYVAIFVRQLGGSLSVLELEGTGTTVRVRFPVPAEP